MQTHDELDAGVRKRASTASKTNDATAEVGHALAAPKTASVQTMLEVQRLAGNAGVSQLLARDEDAGANAQRSPVLDVVGQGRGQPLDPSLRGEMEGRLGADFGDVRLHTDAQASTSARAVQANAYTVGNEVVVRSDRWSPSTDEGKKTLAHELTHVVQQRAGPVEGSSTGDGISVSDPSDRFEQAAERAASQAMASPTPASPGTGSGVSAQLHADDDAHGMTAQRQPAAPDEEQVPNAQMQRQESEPEEEEVPDAQMQRQSPEPEEEEPNVTA